MWSFSVRFVSRSTPKNFMLASLFRSTLSIFSIGRARAGYLSKYVYLIYTENTDFFVLSDNLFVLNFHSFLQF